MQNYLIYSLAVTKQSRKYLLHNNVDMMSKDDENNQNPTRSSLKVRSQTINKGLARFLFPGMGNPIRRILTTICLNFNSFFDDL